MVEMNPKMVMPIVDIRDKVLWRCIAGIRMILEMKGMGILYLAHLYL